MNFGELLNRLAHILGILGNGNTTTTALTSPGDFMSSSTPMIIDTSTLTQYATSENPHSISPKFFTSLATGSPYETTLKDKTASDYSSTFSTETPKATGNSDQTGPTGSVPTGPNTAPTGSVPTGSSTPPTGSVPTGSSTSPTGSVPTGSETSPTGSVPTGSETVPSSLAPTTGGPTGSETAPPTPTGTAPPTEKPKLSRGAVAGIVIGCLLIVAIITAAIVFVVKNRRGPEHQRLNV
ncbi:hypothetical protein TNIN_181531 [Trichonephila inaurata madagascariensis]|uniref:Uncharacterized protein n=1 Tax=Trichonephila inaurata madagascariensis TaxID=2747483 RepID=A0A8X6WW25_9ARAC|nr:hypothetical protein TNIN_181531 [Trichonephila inaurata madagascariensis]